MTERVVPASLAELLPDSAAIELFVTRLSQWGTPAFDWSNERATGTFQRLGGAFATDLFVCTEPLPIISRTPGRTSLDLWVPREIPNGVGGTIATPAGVMVAPNRGILDGGRGSPLNLGDGMPIKSEAGVWVGPQPGASEGYVAFLHCWDPRGGALDA